MSRVLIISDTHAPCMLPEAIDFLRDTYKAWKCDKVIHIGDVVDWHCISYHEKDLSQINFSHEFQDAKKQVKQLTKVFPEVEILTGNHDSLPHRKACTAGLPGVVIRGNNEIWETPKGWKWHPRFSKIDVDNVLYLHGDHGRGGKFPAILDAQDMFQSVVEGHFHASAGVEYHANHNNLVFGMQVGCLVDHEHAQQEYGVKFNRKPILGCGVVLEGEYAYFEPMKL
jgi:predicted phosphodiesterase